VADYPPELKRKLEALRASFASNLAGAMRELESAAQDLGDGAPDEDVHGALQAIHARAHKLAGSAATFGFPRVGEIAQDLEEHCFAMLMEAGPPPGTRQTIADLLATLGEAVEKGD
jgi:HPt (histidine-containing phosphotransfer) domain-containing protein